MALITILKGRSEVTSPWQFSVWIRNSMDSSLRICILLVESLYNAWRSWIIFNSVWSLSNALHGAVHWTQSNVDLKSMKTIMVHFPHLILSFTNWRMVNIKSMQPQCGLNSMFTMFLQPWLYDLHEHLASVWIEADVVLVLTFTALSLCRIGLSMSVRRIWSCYSRISPPSLIIFAGPLRAPFCSSLILWHSSLCWILANHQKMDSPRAWWLMVMMVVPGEDHGCIAVEKIISRPAHETAFIFYPNLSVK